jgi:hypothetical protein
MDRNFFALSLSADGAKFNKMVQLVGEPTRQRFQGHLKCHGYQYPSCLVDGDRLLIGGGMANTFFKAMGYEMGDSLVEAEAFARRSLAIKEETLPPDCSSIFASPKPASSIGQL